MPRYRFTTEDGQTHESTADPETLEKTYPGMTITHTVETDEVTGESTLVPYGETGEGEATPTPANPAASRTVTQPAVDDQTANPTQEASG